MLAISVCAVAFTGCITNTVNNFSSESSSHIEEVRNVFKYEANGEGTCTVTGIINGKTSDVTIPEQLDGNTVTEIGYAAFASNDNIVSLSIPETVKVIGDFAFSNCSNISEIILSENIVSIGEQAFFGCDPEKIIVDSENNVYRQEGNCLIEKESGMIILGSSVSVIPANAEVLGIGRCAFGKCSGMVEIQIPDNVKIIEEYAFVNCTSLKKVVLPEGLKIINSYIFNGCTSLECVDIPGSVVEIKKYAFSDCPIEKIHFDGNSSKWGTVYKYDRWNTNVPEHTVVCTDKEVHE